jgi:hyperosmotically inducible periplasmic protein
MKVAIGSVFVVAALIAGPVSAHAAAPQSAAIKPADKTLDERIESRIQADAILKKDDIKVSVDEGVVTLTGTVGSEAQRTKATRLATIQGVARVNNQLAVDLSAGTRGTKGTMGKIEDKTKEGAEKTKQGAEKAADKTKEGLSKTGEVITDSWITTRIRGKYVGQELLKDSDIDVDTKDHVVTLTGTVLTPAGRARAVAEAKDVEGVHRVVDRIKIGPKHQ